MTTYNTGMAQTSTALDCTAFIEGTGYTITGSQPTDTQRALLFKVGTGNWQKYASGALADVATQTPTAESILSEGNTVAEVSAITSNPAVVGKSVNIAVGMQAIAGAMDMPSLSIAAKGKINGTETTHTYDFDPVTISASEVLIDHFITDADIEGGSAQILVSMYHNSTWSEYTDITAFAAQYGSQVKYRVIATINTIGVGHVQVNNIYCIHAI